MTPIHRIDFNLCDWCRTCNCELYCRHQEMWSRIIKVQVMDVHALHVMQT